LHDDELTSLHEAGHAAVARALGRTLTVVTTVPGEVFAGCTLSQVRPVRAAVPDVDTPLVTWGGPWMERLAGDICITLAGGIAEELRRSRETARLPESVAGQAMAAAEQMPELATPADRAQAAAAVSDQASLSDAGRLSRDLWVIFGSDHARAGAWLRWCEEETRLLLLQQADGVHRLAALLSEHGTVGEQAAAAALRGAVR
jgi:hypothetical protein